LKQTVYRKLEMFYEKKKSSQCMIEANGIVTV